MLTYKNDPLLIEETANDLIKNNRKDLIFLDKNKKTLNLYSAFIRKKDFIKQKSKNQIFQKAIYATGDKLAIKIKGLIKNKKQLIKDLENYACQKNRLEYAYDRWFKKRIFPLILLRIISKNKKELTDLLNLTDYFTDFLNKSRFYPPKKINELLTDKNSYFIGCSIGDGHIDKECRRWVLVDGTSKKELLKYSKEFCEKLKNLISPYINYSKIIEKNTKYSLILYNKPFCRFLNFFFSLPLGKKSNCILKVPLIIKDTSLEKYFWRGCFDTDGSIHKQGGINFCSSDKNLLNECSNYLNRINIKSKKIKEELVVINMPHLKKFSHIGLSHPRKQKEFLKILKRGSKYKDIKIRNKKKINKKLLEIYNLIRSDNNYRIRIHSRNLKNSKFSEKEIKKIIKELFGYKLKTTTKNLLYFKSKKVYEYLNKNFVFEPYWKPIDKKEEIQLLNNWNNVWLK